VKGKPARRLAPLLGTLALGAQALSCVQDSAPARPAVPPPPPQFQPARPAAPPQAAPVCATGSPACSTDRRFLLLTCGTAQPALLSTCFGSAGCVQRGAEITCDGSVAAPGDPCVSEGELACSTDGAQLLACRRRVKVPVSNCRGPKRCVSGVAIECDSSVADANEICDTEGGLACSTDARMLLRCSRGRYAAHAPCVNGGCKSAGGKFLCQ
jgi:hypothetical protein